MKRSSKQLTRRIIELRNAIKRKYNTIKDGAVESDIMLEKQYKPIIEELRKTTPAKTESQSFKEEPTQLKEEPMDYDTTTDEEDDPAPAPVTSTPRQDLTDVVASPAGYESATRYLDVYFHNPLTKKYMKELFKDASGNQKRMDDIYGPHFEGATLMIGDKPLDFDANGNVLIGETKYGNSEGLYELIFKRIPDEDKYTQDDLKAYKSILNATNAHKRNYNFHGTINRNKGIKYRTVIKDLFPPLTRGKGMAWKTTKSRDIIHWDDPNELVERLNHIAMSTETGNRVHTNEIISIVEELREAGYIKGLGNSRFKSLLK